MQINPIWNEHFFITVATAGCAMLDLQSSIINIIGSLHHLFNLYSVVHELGLWHFCEIVIILSGSGQLWQGMDLKRMYTISVSRWVIDSPDDIGLWTIYSCRFYFYKVFYGTEEIKRILGKDFCIQFLLYST